VLLVGFELQLIVWLLFELKGGTLRADALDHIRRCLTSCTGWRLDEALRLRADAPMHDPANAAVRLFCPAGKGDDPRLRISEPSPDCRLRTKASENICIDHALFVSWTSVTMLDTQDPTTCTKPYENRLRSWLCGPFLPTLKLEHPIVISTASSEILRENNIFIKGN